MKRFLFFILTVFLGLEGTCQDSDLIQGYQNSVDFSNHKQEAYKIHNDLIKGILSPEIEALIADSLNGSRFPNRPIVEKFLNDDDFRFHSARIDTSFTVGVKPRMSTSVRFRDICYLGNNQFLQYFLQISFQWDSETRHIKHRFISYSTHVIPSRRVWDRRIWYDGGIYNGLEKQTVIIGNPSFFSETY